MNIHLVHYFLSYNENNIFVIYYVAPRHSLEYLILHRIEVSKNANVINISISVPFVIKPLTLFEPVVHGFLGMLAKEIKIKVKRINTANVVGCGNVIHSMPTIGRELLSAAVYHILKFRISEIFPVKYKHHTPKITLHCMNRPS